ncbi:MAG: MBL fold metallo-hydrolase [Gemmatimonadaceae bacterium]
MFFRQFFDTPLAQASYLIGCQETGDAIVIDPMRDVEPYVRTAAQEGLRITFVTETHIHADFVSGSRELSARVGARVLLSAEGGAEWQYDYAAADNAQLLRDGESFMVGNIRFDVIHTPGHTPEHLSFVITDTPAAAGPMGILTGDFVFVGDVGRPDLLEKAAKISNTMEASARVLYHSLQKFLTLPDHLQLWPGHGAGSACGKALGAVPFSTVGYEKLANWALLIPNEDAFVREVLEGQPDPPRYFAHMKRVNKEGPRVLRGIVIPPKLPAAAIHALMKSNSLVIDIRPAATFAESHVPRTLSIPYNKSFSTWAGSILPTDVEIVLLVNAEPHDLRTNELEKAVRDLANIGFDNVAGWLDQGALKAWIDAGHQLGRTKQISTNEFAVERANSNAQLIDVRSLADWSHEHIAGSASIPMGYLESLQSTLSEAPIVLHCQSGARSAIAASVLMRAGRTNVRNLVGGIDAWKATAHPVEQG